MYVSHKSKYKCDITATPDKESVDNNIDAGATADSKLLTRSP